ncbi:MAG: hypothetical protein HY695_09875 [Deltaproteobacteria bacterium]|nr:hypothetical protein [Deltaproteobacteria bacterium]
MKCRRCLRERECNFRVRTDEINLTVCAPCAVEARRLELPVEALSEKADSLLAMIAASRTLKNHPESR